MVRTHTDWAFIATQNHELSRLAEDGDLDGLREKIQVCDWDISELADFSFYSQFCADFTGLSIDDLEQILDQIPPNVTVLDVGFGYGAVLTALARRGTHPRLCGIDSCETAIRLQQKRTPEVELVCGDACSLPWDAGTFDLVVATELVEHLTPPDAQRFYREAARISTSSAVLLLSTRINENLGHNLVSCPHCGDVIHPSGHIRSFSQVLLFAELRLGGWKVIGEPITQPGGIRVLCRMR